MIYKKYMPELPPGYVFVSNHGALNWHEKVEETEDRIKARMSHQFGIPIEDVVVLRDMAPHTAFSSFVPNTYATRVDAWHRMIADMLDILREEDE